jgi:hypothetical protein
MRVKKAVGLDGIPIEVWNCLGDISVVSLTILFNNICRVNKMPTEWTKSILIPLHKNKENVQNCANYREIKLISHTIKLWKRVVEHKLRRIIKISDN